MENKLPYGIRESEGYPINLDIQFKNRNRMALSYSYLASISYNPSEGIYLNYPTATVCIKGLHLDRLYESLLFHRVEWVREETFEDRGEETDHSEPVISEIALTLTG